MLSHSQPTSARPTPVRAPRAPHVEGPRAAGDTPDAYQSGPSASLPGRPRFPLPPAGPPPGEVLAACARDVAIRAAGAWARPLLDGGLRPTQQAEAFIQRYTADLKLDEAALAEREENLRKSPAAFFRMFPSLFHDDLRGPYAAEARLLDRPAPRVLINGDSHLGNYGTLRDLDGVKWALNDYDQTGPGSPERDLARLATSILLLGQENGLSLKEAARLVKRCARAYVDELERGPAAADLSLEEAHGPVKDLIEKAAAKTHAQLVEKFALLGPDGAWGLRRNDELVEPSEETRTAILAGVRDYEAGLAPTPGIGRPLEILDVAVKLGSGGSSKGLERYYVLLAGVPDDPLPAILELKQILPCPIDQPSGDLSLADPSQIVANQAAMGGPENPLNGVVTVGQRALLAREREGEKLDLKLEKMTKAGWEATAEQAGVVLARAHAFGPGQREALRAWVGSDGEQLAERLQGFARHYAAQAQADFAALTAC